jgi:lipooligosaccharide transport system permease protein
MTPTTPAPASPTPASPTPASPTSKKSAQSGAALTVTSWAEALRSRPAIREFAYWWHRYRRTWRGTVVLNVANPLLFVVALGFGLGQLVDERNSAHLHGHPYLNFVAPGLLAASAMQTGTLDAAGPVFQSARGRGNYRAAVTTPMEPADIFNGHLLFIAFRIALAAAAIIVVITAFGAVPLSRAGTLLIAALLTGVAFAAPMAAYAITVDRPAKLGAVFRFMIMPLYMFSGTFFPAEQLSPWLHPLLWVNPLWHGTELCRGHGSAWLHVSFLLTVIATGYAAGRRAYLRSLTA